MPRSRWAALRCPSLHGTETQKNIANRIQKVLNDWIGSGMLTGIGRLNWVHTQSKLKRVYLLGHQLTPAMSWSRRLVERVGSAKPRAKSPVPTLSSDHWAASCQAPGPHSPRLGMNGRSGAVVE